MRYNTVKGVDKFIRDLKADTNKALLYCGEYLQGKLREQLEVDSYDTGNLARSVTYRQIKDGLVEVGTNLEYAAVREYGRKPGTFPNLDALVGWTARHGMITGGASMKYDDLHYIDKGTIYVIARAIAIKGIKGKHTFEKVYEQEQDNIIKIFNDYMNRKWQ